MDNTGAIELADMVLKRIRGSSRSGAESEPSQTNAHRSQADQAASPVGQPCHTAQEIQGVIASSTDKLSGSSQTVSAFGKIINDNRLIEAGRIPQSFNYKARCVRCGIVMLDHEAKGVLAGCPWCHSDRLPKVIN